VLHLKEMKKYFALAVSLGLVLGINIYFRSFTINFPQLKTRAKEVIGDVIRQGIAQDVYNKFPQFNPLAKDKLIKNRISEYKKINQKIINQQIKDGYRQLKDRYQDETGQTYLMELDCWHWSRYVENVLKLGHPGDQVVNGEERDLFMLAPSGFYLLWENSLYYFSAFLYKIFSLFKPVPLFTFLFYLPLLFITVFIVSLYFFSFRYGSYIGAVTSCLFVGLSAIFLQRSHAGWFDKDILNLLFPLWVIWAYILAYAAPSFKKRSLWICISSLSVGLFCFTWTHWWFVFFIIIIYEFLSLAYLIFARFYLKKENLTLCKQHLSSLFLFLSFSFFWIIIFSRTAPIIALYKQLQQALILNKPLMASIWPNVYSTVGELRNLGLKEIVNSIGGPLLSISSLLCILALLIGALQNRRYTGFKREAVFILVIWALAMFFASSRGIRFVMFLPLPLGVSLGWIMNDLYEYFKNKKNIWGIISAIIVFFIFSVVCIGRASEVAKNMYPLMDDTWYKVLNLIKEKTPQEAIINSWWDFGDWFKVVAGRRVIFDGQSQDKPQAYWMAKALLSNNENEAIGILRMLNNGGNKAFEIINEHIKDQLQAVLLLESIIAAEPEKAEAALLDYLPLPAAQEVMKILFSTPPRACFIVENTMLPKMGAISYLGTWDFSKVYIAKNFNLQEKDQIMEHLKKLGRDNQDIQRFYQEVFLIKPGSLDDWLSRRVLFYSGLVNGQEKDGEVFFDNGFIYNPKEQTIRSNAGQVPRSLFVLNDNELTEKGYPNANVIFSIFVMKNKDNYACVLLDRELANSMLMRLYFFNGQGLRHFIPFIQAAEGNDYILVFNIAW